MAKKFDLEERSAKFGVRIINFAKSLPRNVVTLPLIGQLIRSGTSIGANYCEANNAESRNDFKHKVGIAKKEAKETKYWLQMIATAYPDSKNAAAELAKEAKELNLILNAVINSTNRNET